VIYLVYKVSFGWQTSAIPNTVVTDWPALFVRYANRRKVTSDSCHKITSLYTC
jgi:hypothetical protein